MEVLFSGKKPMIIHAPHLARSKKPHMCVCQHDGECIFAESAYIDILVG